MGILIKLYQYVSLNSLIYIESRVFIDVFKTDHTYICCPKMLIFDTCFKISKSGGEEFGDVNILSAR